MTFFSQGFVRHGKPVGSTRRADHLVPARMQGEGSSHPDVQLPVFRVHQLAPVSRRSALLQVPSAKVGLKHEVRRRKRERRLFRVLLKLKSYLSLKPRRLSYYD